MSDYHKKEYGTSIIKSGSVDNLQINWDFDVLDDYEKLKYPVFLFTPDMDDKQTHYHIALDRAEARKLRDWLNDYLEDR